ncbi:hypothetical protein [Seonamhaeicola sp. S2-3]|uniref:hypothetical protein n=1 Tax=Seonamhaeicola sp. S2-3 TaxID=1936081 RepID=UPI0018DC9921|nr:hypothetical protein [Seonamhaeicola sp. S2-3]
MKKFSLSLSPHITSTTKISVYELNKNGKSLFEPFVDEIEKDGYLFDKLAGALRIIEETSNLKRYPKTKFRELKGHNLSCKVYEAKSNIIRVYLFHEEKTGRVIITGGLKDNQDKDIKAILKIIKEYNDEK